MRDIVADLLPLFEEIFCDVQMPTVPRRSASAAREASPWIVLIISSTYVATRARELLALSPERILRPEDFYLDTFSVWCHLPLSMHSGNATVFPSHSSPLLLDMFAFPRALSLPRATLRDTPPAWTGGPSALSARISRSPFFSSPESPAAPGAACFRRADLGFLPTQL